jgi:hypothetical protein
LDIKAGGSTDQSDQAMAAMGALNRPANGERQGQSRTDAYRGGHRVILRQLTKALNAELRAQRETLLG